MKVNFDGIPAELKEFRQWVCHGADKIPLNPRTGEKASVTKSETWGTFEEAKIAAERFDIGVGFVITTDCPYTFIDVDSPEKKGIQDADEINLIRRVGNELLDEIDSYAELSPSGEGFHIIARTKVPSGHKSNCFEIYPNDRYMTVTGKSINNKSINGNAEAVHRLWELLKPRGIVEDTGYDEPERWTDSQVIEMVIKQPAYFALANGNRDEYWNLIGAKPQDSSASVSDLNLMNRIAYFSRNRAQTIRLFKSSGCHRPQVKKGGYVERSVAKAFDKMTPPIDLESSKLILQNALAKQAKEQPQPEPTAVAQYEPHSSGKGVYTNPGGLLGMIADYFYDTSFKQVPEIALATAITFMAGPAGRAYRVDGLGLNMYTMILASTATGKSIVRKGPQLIREAMTTRTLQNAMNSRSLKKITNIGEFFGPKAQSGIALYKAFAEQKSFACFFDEMAGELKAMWHPNAKPDVQMEFDLYLNLFSESGAGGSLDELAYSDKDKSVGRVVSPSFSWIGVTVPDRFYDAITEKALYSGFLPRMLVIEYESGEIKKDNLTHSFPPSDALMDAIEPLVENAHLINNSIQFKPVDIAIDPEARAILNQWKESIRITMNSDKDETKRAIWSRVAEKVLKLAGLVAVGYNVWTPTITSAHMQWAMDICNYEAEKLLKRFGTGEIGESMEPKQLQYVKNVIAKFVKSDFEKIAKFGLNTAEHAAGQFPHRFVQGSCNVGLFNNDRMGGSFAIKRALRTLLDNGQIQELAVDPHFNGLKKSPRYILVDTDLLTGGR